jgi:Zn-dependent protease
MSEIATMPCGRCGEILPSTDALACPHCGALVHAAELTQLSAEAKWQERFNPARAIAIWEECLKRLPPESGQYAAVQSEISRLRSAPPVPATIPEPGALPTIRQESIPIAILKTTLPMALSIFVYKFSFGWTFAFGFVLLILVHEMGHVVANIRYGLRASPPIFIPYVGAVISLRQNPPNARVEAIIGIAGPIAGTIASLAAYGIYLATHSEMALVLAWFGFTMNLFNLLPVPPLDGGRVAAAISPWVWVLGLGGLGWMLWGEFRSSSGPGILLLVLIVALPRIIKTLKPSGRSGKYYAIGKAAPIAIGAAYLTLLAALIGLRWYSGHQMPQGVPF